MLTKEYGYGEHLDQTEPNTPHESNLLMIDITKAQTRLDWQPRLSTAEAIALTAIANALTLVFAKILVNIKFIRKNFSKLVDFICLFAKILVPLSQILYLRL